MSVAEVQDEQASVRTNTTSAPNEKNQAKVTSLAGFFGAALEYYDMYIFASASALVFSRIFFPDAGATGLLLSLATYGVAYLARPAGGFFAGHFGDRFGRKNVMIATLLIMGIATFLIGCLPSHDTIGIWAPVLLVLLRLMQGLSVGGEASGSTTLTMEHAPEGKRGLYTSWMVNGIWVGYILATLAFVGVAALPEEQLLTWGWRLPFWLSAAIVIVGLMIRRSIEEPEAFTDAADKRSNKLPVAELMKNQPLDVVRVIFASFLLVISSVVPVYGLTYATNVMGIPANVMLWAAIFGYATALVSQPLFALISDKIGRKPVLIIGNLIGAVSVWEFFWAVGTSNIPMVFLGMFLCITIGFGCTNAVYPVFFSEMFNVKFRVSGMAIGLQIGLVITGFSPSIIQAVSSANSGAWWPAAALTTVACVISAISVATSRETYKVPLDQLGLVKS